MKKVFTVFLSLLLCAGILSSSFAFAASGEGAEGYSVAEQETDPMLETRIMLAKGLNALSNFFLNDFLGTALKLMLPDSAAVADYEDFNIDEYGNITSPQFSSDYIIYAPFPCL